MYRKSIFQRGDDVKSTFFWYTFPNILNMFCENDSSGMLQKMNNDNTVPIQWKNGFFVSFL